MEDETNIEENSEIGEDTFNQGMIDESGDFQEADQERQDQAVFTGNIQEPGEKDSIFTFFRHLLRLGNSSKVANLDKRELGMLDLSVRNNEYLSKLGDLLHNKSYQDFFRAKSEIILSTSMSKKGWLPELVVSQKKFTQRMVQPVNKAAQQKAGFLGFGKKPAEPAQQ
jgi:hypothetical protein